jgi:hypothetical protein
MRKFEKRMLSEIKFVISRLSVSRYYQSIVPEELSSWKLSGIKIVVRCQLLRGKVSVSDLKRLRQGQFGNCASIRYLFGFGHKYLHNFFLLSLGLKLGTSLPSLSILTPSSSPSSPIHSKTSSFS